MYLLHDICRNLQVLSCRIHTAIAIDSYQNLFCTLMLESDLPDLN